MDQKSMKLFDKNRFHQPLRLQYPKLWIIILVLLLNLVAIISMVIFRNESSGPGYPLDDSWIHQTYARNLADSGNWGYSLNDKSAGSTSPLWTILLIPGFLFGVDNPYVWTMILSILCYWGLLFVALKFISLDKNLKNIDVVVFGIIMAFEWHFLWAAGSGMETILFIFVTFLIFYLLHKEQPNGNLIGLLTGALVFIRPDGLTLLGPILFVFLAYIFQKKLRKSTLVGFFVFLLIPLVLYGIHNYSLSGSVLPNTFSAKTQEYQEVATNTNRFQGTQVINGIDIRGWNFPSTWFFVENIYCHQEKKHMGNCSDLVGPWLYPLIRASVTCDLSTWKILNANHSNISSSGLSRFN